MHIYIYIYNWEAPESRPAAPASVNRASQTISTLQNHLRVETTYIYIYIYTQSNPKQPLSYFRGGEVEPGKGGAFKRV